MPYWCFENCKANWDARWGKRLPNDVSGLFRLFNTVAQEQARVEMAIAEQMPQPSDPTTWEEVREQILRLAPAQPLEVAPIKLTREQFESIRAASPVYPEYARPSTFGGVPVQLVDTVEESTPYQQACERGAAYPQVAPEVPQVGDFSELQYQPEPGWLGLAFKRVFGRGTIRMGDE